MRKFEPSFEEKEVSKNSQLIMSTWEYSLRRVKPQGEDVHGVFKKFSEGSPNILRSE